MSDRVEVMIDRPAFPGEVEAVEKAFAGIDADVIVGYEVRGAGDYPWIVFVTLTGITVTAFFRKLVDLAAEDAYAGLKRWANTVADARRRYRKTSGTVDVRDAHISRIVLRVELPDEAFALLLEMDLDALPDGAYLVWDGEGWKNV